MADWIARIVYRARVIIGVVVIGAAALLTATVPPIEFDQSVEGFFPQDDPALKKYLRSKAAFGADDVVFLAYDDPKLWSKQGMQRVRSLAEKISEHVVGVGRIDAIDEMPVPWRVHAAATSMATGSSRLGRLMAARATVGNLINIVEERPETLQLVRQRICSHPLFRGQLVDPSGRTAAIMVWLAESESVDRKQTVQQLRDVTDAFAAEHGLSRAAVAGPPVLVADGFRALEHDNRRLGGVAMVLMSLTMLVAIRNPWWAMLPLVAGWSTWMVTQAFITFFDLRLTLSSGPIVAQTVVLCMPAASHLAIHFQQSMRQGVKRPVAAYQALLLLFAPVAWCAVTAASGYLATSLASSVVPVSQFGLTMFVCNLLAGIIAYCLAAGAMGIGRRVPKQTDRSAPAARVADRVGGLTGWVLAHPLRTLLLFVAPILVTTIGSRWLEFESNYINIFKRHSRVVRDYHFLEERMGGIGLVELVFPAPQQLTPDWVAKLKDSAQRLYEADPELVAGVVSLGDVLGPAEQPEDDAESSNGTDDTTASNRSPASDSDDPHAQEILDVKLRLLGTRAYSHILDTLWNREANTARVLVRISESSLADRKERCFERLGAIARNEISAETYLTGLSHLMTQITRAVISTAFESGLWSLGLILTMLAIAMRSLRLAVLALVPTLLSVGLVLGLMGWLGLKIDLSTAIVASVAIGLSVDDSFHCLLRWKKERQTGQSPRAALEKSYAQTGPGVVLSSSAVSLGFFAMVFSEFIPTANFGWLVAVATFGGSAGNVIVLPACLALVTRIVETD